MIDPTLINTLNDVEKEATPDWTSVWKPISTRKYLATSYLQLPPWPNEEAIIRHRAMLCAGLGYMTIRRVVSDGYVTETLVYKDRDFTPRECGQ